MDDGAGEDRLSELPDELLVEILERTDSFTATSTAVLSRRWRQRDLCRWLTAFDFPITPFLPPEYDQLSAHYRFTKKLGDAAGAAEAIAERLGLCEKRATESYVRAVAGLLRFPRHYPSIKRLRLEFFLAATGTPLSSPETEARLTWCVRSAVRRFHVEHLVVDAIPGARAAADGNPGPPYGPRPYVFPLDLLDSKLGGHRLSRLANLSVKNCEVRGRRPSSYRLFHSLTRLAVEHTSGAYCTNSDVRRILRTCRRLESLRLTSCVFVHNTPFRVDTPPESSLRELVVDGCDDVRDMVVDNAPSLEELVVDRCQLSALRIVNAPKLRSLVCRNVVEAPELGAHAARGLRYVDVGFLDPGEGDKDTLRRFLSGVSPRVEELVLRFQGTCKTWVKAEHFSNRFHKLSKFLVQLPASWPLHWMNALLQAAPYLEKLLVHTSAPRSEGDRPTVQSSDRLPGTTVNSVEHGHLKEIEVVGFDGRWQQMEFARSALSSCAALKTVFLVRSGRGGGGGEQLWEEDRLKLLVALLRSGSSSSAQIVLGRGCAWVHLLKENFMNLEESS